MFFLVISPLRHRASQSLHREIHFSDRLLKPCVNETKTKRNKQSTRRLLTRGLLPYDLSATDGNHFMIKNEIINLIKNKRARVGVIGLGYVGLPLATEFASAGFKATGFEVDEKKVGEINAGRSYIADVSSETIQQSVDAARLSATTDFDPVTARDCVCA